VSGADGIRLAMHRMATRAEWRWLAIVCLLAGIGLPLAGQWLPPLNLLNHEFTQGFTGITAVVLFFVAGRVARRQRPPDSAIASMRAQSDALLTVLVAALAMAVSGLGTMAIMNGLGPQNRFSRGVPFFWVTWTPAVVLACVGGTLLGARQWRGWQMGLALAAAAGLSALQDAAQALAGVRMTDFFLGVPLAFDQRATMEIPMAHISQRLFLLVFALGLWCMALARSDRGPKNGDPSGDDLARCVGRFGRLLLVVWLGWLAMAENHAGLGWSRHAIRSYLSERVRTEHFLFYYPATGSAACHLDPVVRNAEWCWKYLCRQWKIQPTKPVTVFLFNGPQDLQELTGSGAHAYVRSIYIDYPGATGKVLLHELVHALHVELQPSLWVALRRGDCEGLAMAYEMDYARIPEAHRAQAGAARLGKLPAASQVMSPWGFWRINEQGAYLAAGSFVGFLLREFGLEKFREFEQTLDYRRVYGMDLVALDVAWRAFLGKIPVDLDAQAQALANFDAFLAAGYLEQPGGKLGKRVPSLEDKAMAFWQAQDYARSADLFQQLFAKEHKVKWACNLAQCWRRMDRLADAVRRLRELNANPKLPPVDRAQILKTLIPCLMVQRDWTNLYAAWEEQGALESSPAARVDQEMVKACLQNPELRDAVARALTTNDAYERRHQLEELARRYPRHEGPQYLYVSRELGRITLAGYPVDAESKQLLRDYLDRVETIPKAIHPRSTSLLALAARAIELREFDLAERMAVLLERYGNDALVVFRARVLRERIAFERAYPPLDTEKAQRAIETIGLSLVGTQRGL
jgi:hypothetical protein